MNEHLRNTKNGSDANQTRQGFIELLTRACMASTTVEQWLGLD